MAYGNAFPMGYQYYQQYQNPYQAQAQMPAPQQNSGIIWVQGEAGAKSYLIAPNTTVQLWDSERQTIYLKSADASGMPSIKTFDYTIRQEGSGSPVNGFQASEGINISKSDLDGLQSQIDALRSELENIKKGTGASYGKSDLQSDATAGKRQ